MTGPLRLVTILTVLVGFAGAILGIALGGVTGSIPAVGGGLLVFVASLSLALQGAPVYGATAHRP